MPTTTYTVLREATLRKQQILAEYQGYVREMSPHVLGWKNGREKALFYQFAGESRSGLGAIGGPANWRCVFVDELDDVSVRDGDFFTAPTGPQRQTCVDEVDVEAPF